MFWFIKILLSIFINCSWQEPWLRVSFLEVLCLPVLLRGSLLGWLVLMAGLLQPGFLQAQTSEERLSALEARLSRLERNLELLVQKVASASPLDPQAVKELKDATQPLASELQQLQAANVPRSNPPQRQFSKARLSLRPLPSQSPTPLQRFRTCPTRATWKPT